MGENKDEMDIDIEQNDEDNIADELVIDEDIDEDGKAMHSVKKVRDKLKACEAEKKEYLDGWQRCKADSVNRIKADEERKAAAIKSAREDAFIAILPVLDSFDMAFGNEEAHAEIDPNWVAGMKHIQSQLVSILSDHGIKQIDPTGSPFDPNQHESIEMREVEDEKDDEMIIKVVQKGYATDAQVLRPAKVIVGTFKNN